MTLTAFDCRLGLGQGRLRRQARTPGSGEHVFVIGDDEPGRMYDLAPGDLGEVTQQVDLTGADLVRALLHLRVPDTVPAGMAWEASIVIDGAKLSRATCLAGKERTMTDLAANVSKLVGMHQVGVRLQLVGV
jgi:hypothetical protein